MTLLPHLLWNTRVGSVQFCSSTFITYRLPLSLSLPIWRFLSGTLTYHVTAIPHHLFTQQFCL